ncbi:uncharacterized protein M421DRAFT_8632 [Didymella exigua CBS 183.55]|uniref:NAD(P)-binding protein n=1 Tax=Didymella exigua CBS 183.55 TaxID=1150837 RepID=A0A6A5RB70_9PLEO|nr:uncharacterized protein M421DRAFT_8632 [Didymella exigua CBS 183.55]KAF1924530.1 hypothetical protein M421DRAFT_8632 [Didymella exigua CBS 183.55]
MSRYAEAQKVGNLRGAGDARPTALQVIQDEGLTGKLTDKVFLITGVSPGIGIETLRALHTTGALVFDTRSLKVTRSSKHHLPRHVRSGAADFLQKSNDKVNLLVANAGIMATPYEKTVDGFESQFGTNHVAHFLLFQLLKPALLAFATPEYLSRVVSVTSRDHFFGPPLLDDYNFETTPYGP